jgi:hypothetical protein
MYQMVQELLLLGVKNSGDRLPHRPGKRPIV